MNERENMRPVLTALFGLAALAGALTVAGEVYAQEGPQPARLRQMAPPTPIARLTASEAPVAVRGRVAERFGGDFILDDGTGRALIETGPRGDDAAPVAIGATVTAQGRFTHGVLRAMLITDAAGTVTRLAPPGRFGMGRPAGEGARPPCGRDTAMPPPG